ncbi:hypothetical protein SVAN01_03524 [Stagonosporopsis vannaccii]|nr:hypothetical protein SVAN01_03524 [Stagonosporopsis vannaccii]
MSRRRWQYRGVGGRAKSSSRSFPHDERCLIAVERALDRAMRWTDVAAGVPSAVRLCAAPGEPSALRACSLGLGSGRVYEQAPSRRPLAAQHF